MKSLILIALLSFSMFCVACPKGEHPRGGYDNHHHYGYCSF